MTDEPQPLLEPPAGPPPPAAREPFWNYSDLLLLVGMAMPAMLVGMLAVKGVVWAFELHLKLRAVEIVPAQFLGYALLFGALAVLFRVQYDRPFWDSLAWRPAGMPAGWIVLNGVLTAVGVSVLGVALRIPDTANPMKEMLSDPVSLAVVGLFGVTLGPMSEELLFRGFLQPLLVRSLGPMAGVAAAAVPFGLLHLQQYGYSWRHVVLITGAGVSFGWIRHITGSTRASTLMHAAYNGLFFCALLAQWKDLPQKW